MSAEVFASGVGLGDTREKDGRQYDGMTFAELLRMVKSPPSRSKHASRWAIFSTYREPDARVFKVQATKGRFVALAGDVDHGNPSMAFLKEALLAVFGDVSMVIYSTASASHHQRKWRYVVPLSEPLAGDRYTLTQQYVFELMDREGITCDAKLRAAGQLINLPNANGFFYQHDIHRPGVRFDAATLQVPEPVAKPIRPANPNRGRGNSPIDVFNRTYTCEHLMECYGFKRRGQDWRSPLQQGNTYATMVTDENRWVSLSSSDAAVGRCDGTVTYGDAFDLYRYYEHNGDMGAAVEGARKLVGLDDREVQQ